MPSLAHRRKSNPRARRISPNVVQPKGRPKGAASIIERTLEPIGLPLRAAQTKCETRRLPLRMQRQRHSNWCWAAVATSVARFYRPDVKWTQCEVANEQLGSKICCRKGARGKCNKVGHLKYSLRTVEHARRPIEIKRAVPFSKVREEIDADNPVCVRTVWRGSQMGHFLAIVGHLRECELLTIADPFFGSSYWHYRAFREDYRHSGQWKNSYYTKR
jgi:hypothetical protein